jgi:putative transposase
VNTRGKNPKSATVINKKGVWYIHMVIEIEAERCDDNGVMGIDLGINNIATTSTGLMIEGRSRRHFKEQRAKVRASLQSRNTPASKRVLKRLSGREKRRITHENHVISKQLIENAQRHNIGTIRMEQLKHIRDKTKTWNKHKNRLMAGWSFYELQQFVTYKASSYGIAVELIDPAYTSQTCFQCLRLGSREKERFLCLTCGETHADVNASHVISLGGVACKPSRISSIS